MSIKVNVTVADIRAGIADNCHLCPIALALHRATKDDHARVSQLDYDLGIYVWAGVIPAPYQVRRFVMAFDDLHHRNAGKPKLPKRLKGTDFEPFSFEIPDIDSPEWKEECCECEHPFDRSELDDEGRCEECRGEVMRKAAEEMAKRKPVVPA
jgi:hypothetical protein